MWKQLELFDNRTDVEYALSLTSHELASIKQSNTYSYELIKNLRAIVGRCESIKRGADSRAAIEIEKLLSGTQDFSRYFC